jgi:hypothetical protein
MTDERGRRPVRPLAAATNPAVAELIELGEALHGPHYMNPLARDLGIAQRTISNWTTGRTRFREGPILVALRHLVESHTAAVARARIILGKA